MKTPEDIVLDCHYARMFAAAIANILDKGETTPGLVGYAERLKELADGILAWVRKESGGLGEQRQS